MESVVNNSVYCNWVYFTGRSLSDDVLYVYRSVWLSISVVYLFVHGAGPFRTYASPWRRTNSVAAAGVVVNGHYVLAPDEVVSADRWMLAVTHP